MARTYLIFGDIEGKLDVLRVAITASLRKTSQDRANASQSGKIQYASSRHYLEQRKVAAMRKSMLNRIAIVVVAAALGSAAIATEAVARGDGGAGHGGGAMSGGRIGGGFSGGHFGGGNFAGRFKHGHHGRARGLTVPFGYDDSYSGDYDPSVTPEEQPAYPTAAYPDVRRAYPTTAYPDVRPAHPTTAYPDVQPPRSGCSTQTYKVPSEGGVEASINVVRC